jgi:hypothetical protein
MPQNTNLNISPYFDDFDNSKNYQRVLFKPGTPIQARELTTLQSILQNQIEKFGTHFFKEGSMVIPGQIAYDPDYTCVQINDSHLGIPVSAYINNLVGKLIKGQTSNVVAKVENFITNLESERSSYTLYIKYISSSDTNFTTSEFVNGENLITLENIEYPLSAIRANGTFASTLSSNSTFTGSAVKIENGIYFIRGFFVDVSSQTVILDQYSNLPSYRIGLAITEELAIASNDYDDLYDNAQGFSNFAAPGADRLVISTTLIKKNLDDFNDENFIELIRIRNGEIEKFVNRTDYTLIQDELARRTYDESGDYYIRPFGISIKECVNDRLGNNGIFIPGEQTRQGNLASENLACISISPGKAYVRGYEIETNNVLLDIEKPRTTERIINENLQFSFGNQLLVNNVYGSIPVGFTTASQVELYDRRNSNPGKVNGEIIGISKVYDFEARSSEYVGPQTQYVISLYDTQIFTRINVNIKFDSLSTPTLIEGKNSGARGFLYSSVTNSDTILLYDVSGSFNLNEPIRIDGIESNRLVTNILDYTTSDVHQISANRNNVAIGTFTSDTILSDKLIISDVGASFTISAQSAGISTISTSEIYFNRIKIGDIISYTKPGDILPTYNRINSIEQSQNKFTISSVPTVSNVCVGSLPTNQLVASDVRKVQSSILNPTSNFYTGLNNKNTSNIDLENTNIIVKRSFFDVNVSSNQFTFILDNETLSFESFDEENYNLTYVNTGNIFPLIEFENISFSSDRKQVTVSGLSETGPTIFTATCKINKVSSRKKFYNRCSSLIIDKSNSISSGVGRTTLNDGLNYNKAYGTRVQDKEISLNVPDVIKILAIYESSTTQDPKTPEIGLSNISSNILNAVKGEQIVGTTSNSIGYFINYLNNSQIEFTEANENNFILGEQIVFQESGIVANIETITLGDKNIINSYSLDSGYRDQYLDFSRIVRKDKFNIPNKKIRIIYNNYTIADGNSGDLVTINSYDADRYKSDLPRIDDLYASDILDLRPSVSQYSGEFSPFESKSRVFTESSNSTPHIFSKNSTINISYDYYLPRIDKLFLYKDGNFVINTGIPSKSPAIPQALDNALEIATLKLPAYVRDIDNIEIQFNQHKRYTMKDISRIEDRLKDIEYYTLLSLLEQDTKNLTIRDDDTGLDRFKSGFLVDNFREISGGNISNVDFRASIDTRNGNLRPIHYTTGLNLILGSSKVLGLDGTSPQTDDLRYALDLGTNNVKRIGDIVCLNYNELEYVKNPFATRTENVNPFNVINWIGTIELNPSSDDWVETRRLGERISGTIEGDYLDAIRRLNVDSNVGLSPIEWGAWETTWTGIRKTRNTTRVRRTITTTDSTTTTTDQRRVGTQFEVSEQFDSISLGDRIISTSSVRFMRSRNIEIIARRLKPKTRFYAFFDDVNITEYIIPKLIEITMQNGTFIEGETVTGILGSKQIRFKLAPQNHKYGPLTSNPINLPPNYPIEVYRTDPYNPDNSLPNIYSATSTTLNVDTTSLEVNSISEFFGCIAKGMRLVGRNSQAVAVVRDIRLISDEYGTFIGSVFIPDPTVPSTPSFETGTKSLTITTSQVNSPIYGFSDSSGISEFSSRGILENIEASSLRIRNASIESIERVDQRRLQTTTTTTQTQVIRHTDPLAQSFLVDDRNGICITKCDVYFKSKDSDNIPVTLQVRTLELGLPTQIILPFSEVTLNPNSVNISDDGKASTTFYFPSPIYLEGGREYAIVLLSASNEYNVWISRMGEVDVSTLDLPENDRIIVSQQPSLGSLFKSQNGSTWDPSQYEDLKFTLHRADFISQQGSVRLYNPDLNIGNDQVVSLSNNPIFSYSKSSLVAIGKSFTISDIGVLSPGSTITQEGNTYFRSDLVSVVGAIGIGSTLVITDPGTGFGNTTTIYNNVNLRSFTGLGQGAKANIGIVAGVAKTVTITDGGSGYIFGDVLNIDSSSTNNLGRDLIISVPNIIGIITAFNSILLDNIQGDITVDTTSNIVANGVTLTSAPVLVPPSVLDDGLHFRVNHSNHGMYSYENFVTLVGIEPDIPPIKLTNNVGSTSEEIFLSSVGILTTFENIPVNADNPGYVLINNEVIRYTDVDVPNNRIFGITRSENNYITSADPILQIAYYSQTHSVGDDVLKYEFNGISLRRINTTHNLNLVDKNKYPITLDSYHIKVDMQSNQNKNRSSATGTEPLFFNSTKFGGSFRTIQLQKNTIRGPKATQNILMTSIRPNIQTLVPETTNISARIRTVSGTSVNGSERSFIDKGFEGISLNSNNFFDEPRLISSKINEDSYLGNIPGKKSFTLELTLSTRDRKVSPMIDLDRINIIATMNRLDNPVISYKDDERINEIGEDPHASVYVSKLVRLEKPADQLKVIFDAYRHSSNDIRVAYRLIRDNIPVEQQIYELFPGFNNLDNNKNIIEQSNNTGSPDRNVNSSNNLDDYKNYEYTAKNLPEFTGYQIKIMMSGTSQSNVPIIRDFRSVATR